MKVTDVLPSPGEHALLSADLLLPILLDAKTYRTKLPRGWPA